MPPRQTTTGTKPRPALAKAEREQNVVSLRLNVGSELTVPLYETVMLSAVPQDSQGNVIHGLQAEWSSSDFRIAFVSPEGEVLGGKPGTATISAHVGNVTQSIHVTVTGATDDGFG